MQGRAASQAPARLLGRSFTDAECFLQLVAIYVSFSVCSVCGTGEGDPSVRVPMCGRVSFA